MEVSEKEKPVSDSVKKKMRSTQGPCIKFTLWIFAIFAVGLLTLLLSFTVWTLVTYHQTISKLQNRVEHLEKECKNYNKEDIYVYASSKIEELFNEVRYK